LPLIAVTETMGHPLNPMQGRSNDFVLSFFVETLEAIFEVTQRECVKLWAIQSIDAVIVSPKGPRTLKKPVIPQHASSSGTRFYAAQMLSESHLEFWGEGRPRLRVLSAFQSIIFPPCGYDTSFQPGSTHHISFSTHSSITEQSKVIANSNNQTRTSYQMPGVANRPAAASGDFATRYCPCACGYLVLSPLDNIRASLR
jgi:hypothetical protein